MNLGKNEGIGRAGLIVLPLGTREFHLADKAEGQLLNTKGASNREGNMLVVHNKNSEVETSLKAHI